MDKFSLAATASSLLQSTGEISPLISVGVNYGSAILGGLLSFFSPCVFPLIPIFFGVLMTGAESIKARFLRGVSFTIGMSLFFFLIGIGVGGLGQFIRRNETLMNLLSGSLFIAFAFMYLFEIGFRGVRINAWKFSGSIFSGFLLGSVLGLIWVPCAGPILGSILVLAANQETAAKGGALLFAYSLGLSIPFLTLSGVVAKITSRLSFEGKSKTRKIVRIIVFILLFGAGVMTIFGKLNLLQFASLS